MTLIELGRGPQALKKLVQIASMPPGLLALIPRLTPITERGGICIHCLLILIEKMGNGLEKAHGPRLAHKRVAQFLTELEQMTEEELREWWAAEDEQRRTRSED